MPFVTLNAVTLHYRFDVPAPGQTVLVFSNSLGTDARIWNDVLDSLGERYGTLVYDQRGHGLSDLGGSSCRLEDHAADLANLMDHLGIARAVVVGLSVGGMIAQLLAVERPDLANALVLCGTAHRIGTSAAWNARIAAIEDGGIASIADDILDRWFTPSFRRPDNANYRGYRNMLCRQDAAGYCATCASIRDADLAEPSARLSLPVLCLVGDQDGATPPELVRSLADLIPYASFAVIEGAGHLPCIEQPGALADQVRRFVDT